MNSPRSLATLSAVSVFLTFSAAEARASAVTYHFAGSCFSGSSPGDCGYFGLSDGDPVAGSITVDGDRLSTTEFAAFLPTDPDLDFSFTFGSLSVGKSDLDPFSEIRVMLADPSGLGIVLQNSIRACVDAIVPCVAFPTDAELLEIGTSGGLALKFTDFGSLPAFAAGEWIRERPIPEPSVTILFTLALAGLTSRRRRPSRLN